MKLQVHSGWKTTDILLKPNSIFALEYMDAMLLIDMVKFDDFIEEENLKSVYDSFITNTKININNSDTTFSDTDEIILENLITLMLLLQKYIQVEIILYT